MIMFILVVLCFSFPPSTAADRGGIPIHNAALSEPGQKALITFNGREELLVLGTNIQADREVAVVELAPFPSPPVVELTPVDIFTRLKGILEQHGVGYHRLMEFLPEQTAVKTLSSKEAVELISYQHLGVHDITVVKINDTAGFAAWLETYLKRQGFPARLLTPAEEAVIADYCARGFKYFVCDLVHLEKEVRSVLPLAYRFRTARLYYPLKITNLYGGQGDVELICCTSTDTLERLWHHLPPTVEAPASGTTLPVIWQCSDKVKVDTAELVGVYPKVGGLLNSGTHLQAFRYRGKMLFKRDIWVNPEEVLLEVNGNILFTNPPPRLAAGRCFVAARFFFEALGAQVKWNATSREAVMRKKGLVLRLPVDPQVIEGVDPETGHKIVDRHYVAYLNGNCYDLDLPPLLADGQLFLWVRFVAKVLDADVAWDGQNRKVSIKIL